MSVWATSTRIPRISRRAVVFTRAARAHSRNAQERCPTTSTTMAVWSSVCWRFRHKEAPPIPYVHGCGIAMHEAVEGLEKPRPCRCGANCGIGSTSGIADEIRLDIYPDSFVTFALALGRTDAAHGSNEANHRQARSATVCGAPREHGLR